MHFGPGGLNPNLAHSGVISDESYNEATPSNWRTTTLNNFELDNSFGLSLRDDEGPSSSSPGTDLHRSLSDVAEGSDSARLSALLCDTPLAALGAAIAAEKNISSRKRTLRHISEKASPAAVLAAAKASAYAFERPMSTALAALLNKLASNATEHTGSAKVAADHAFRDLFRDIIESWSAGTLDTGSSGYDALFQQAQPEQTARSGTVAPEPIRVLDLAFETGAMGTVVWSAVSVIGETQEGVRRILDMIKHAPAGSHAASVVAQQFANAPRLATLLHEDPVDFDAVDALIPHMGEAAAPAMLDGLVDAKSRATRRGLLDRLVTIGPGIGPMIADRLKSDHRWYVQRNMLTLLREANCQMDQVQLEKYTTHADARVRREATQILFSLPMERDRALAAAMRDTDPGLLKVALRAARESMPESIVPILAKRVVDPDFPPEFRTSALFLLTRSSSVLALEALLRFALGGTTLLGKPKLANKSPEMLIAISGLSRVWPNERRAVGLIALARDSKDPEIAKAAVGNVNVAD